MRNIKQSLGRALTLNRGAVLSVVLFAPLTMAPKGCSSGVVGDDCPAGMTCPAGGSGNAGSGNAGSGNAGSSNAGAGGGAQGTVCGGLLGAQCVTDEYCSFTLAAQCGSGDQTGTCVKMPQGCTEEYVPVCGCDGKTYGNSCSAAATGVSVRASGACDAPTGDTCGGLHGTPCAKSQYCYFPATKACGATDETGTCAPIPTACTDESNPVCGCDGKTYGNPCGAAAAGVSVREAGACDAGTTCGGLLGTPCAKSQYCNFPASQACGATDGTGTCTPIPTACTDELNPVCGCDGKTYGNPCAAAAAGVSVFAAGACK